MEPSWEEAVRRGDIGAVRDQLARGADANARNRHGQTALMLAAHGGHLAVVQALLAHGVDTDVAAKYGLTALMLAVVAGHADIARLIARAGADRTLRGTGTSGFAGKTAYELALARGMHDLLPDLATHTDA